ncbi:MAG: hypothetical protein MI974_22445 [Chitinophagales bacterium]|nr:hypothetical protein [Chitinophagales bacterium]
MNICIKFSVIFCLLLVISACNPERKFEPLLEKQDLLIDARELLDVSSLPDINSYHGMLHFNDEFELEDFIDSVNVLRADWSIEPATRASILDDFNAHYDYVSLETFYQSLNGNEESEEGYIAYPVMQFLLNEKKEFAVGDKIYKYLNYEEVAVIENLSIEALDDVRETGLHSTHELVSYFNSELETSRKNNKGSGGHTTVNSCSGYLSIFHSIGRGDTANRVSLDGFIKQLSGICGHALAVTIDWGDGTVQNINTINNLSFFRYHDYDVSADFMQGNECYDYTITVELEWKQACGNCPKGRKVTKEIEVELCYRDDLCEKSDIVRSHSEIKTLNSGVRYKLEAEIGMDNSLNIFTQWTNKLWAEVSFYKAPHPTSIDWEPAYAYEGIGLDITGPLYGEESCLIPATTIEPSPNEITGTHYEEEHNILYEYTKRTGDDRITGSFWAGTSEHPGNTIQFEIKI